MDLAKTADPVEAAELLDALKLVPSREIGEGSGSDGEGAAAATDGGVDGKPKRKRAGKRKGKGGAGGASADSGTASSGHVSSASGDGSAVPEDEPSKSERLKFLNKSLSKIADKPHSFWDTQPVPKLGEGALPEDQGPIEEDVPTDSIRAAPLDLPEGFVWSDVDLTVPEQLNEVYELLAGNYVEDDEALFRFNYSPEFLLWALTPPGYYPDWHAGVRVVKTGKLLGFISGVPAHISMRGITKKMCEINFLCVHKKLRSKRLAPVLIKEVTRRVNRRGMFQAVYTAGVALPKPVSACQYFHRSLNIRKLVEVGFSRLPPKVTMTVSERLHKLDPAPRLPGIRPMTLADVSQCCALLNGYLSSRFGLHPVMNEEEFAHNMLPRPGVMSSFVIPDARGAVTDFCSYYHLTSSVLSNPKHKLLNAVYAYYTVPGKHTLEELFMDMLILAKQEGKDVFNCLDMMDNTTFFKNLKFGPGDGLLHYYLYNWRCPQMDNSKIGLVLV